MPGSEYENILQYTHENNSESVFEFNFLNDVNNQYIYLNRNAYAAYTGWRGDAMTFPDRSDIYGSTWGFCNPQKDLYDAFVANDGANGLRLKQSIKSFNDDLVPAGYSISSGKELYGNEGYLMWKSRKVSGEFIGSYLGSHNNIRIMRYPEVLLLAAEAHLKGGGGKAADYVSQVRTRAGLSAKGSVTMDDIMLEKRLELCGESIRYQDMIRWGIAGTKMSAQGTKTPTLLPNGTVRYDEYNNAATAGFKERHKLLPFPQDEITNNELINQNEGWGGKQ
jgi:hypothetical protein